MLAISHKLEHSGASPWLTLENNQWGDMLEHGQIKEYENTETIVNIGTVVDQLYYILKGSVKYTVFNKEGQEKILAFWGPGVLFGEGPIFSKYPTTLHVIANSKCRVCEFNYEQVMELLCRKPELAVEIISSMSYKLQLSLDQLTDLSFKCSKVRVINLIYRLALNPSTATPTGVLLPIELTQQELANLAGCSLRTVSRVLGSLKKQGLIDYAKHHLIVNDLDTLKKICAAE